MANFEITITDVNEPILEGRTLDVDYEVENTGSTEGIQDVFLVWQPSQSQVGAGSNFNDSTLNESTLNSQGEEYTRENSDKDIRLAAGETATGTLQFDTTGLNQQIYTAGVFTDDDSVTFDVDVRTDVLIVIDSPNEGELDADRTPEINYRIDSDVSGSVSVQLNGSEVESKSTPVTDTTFTTTGPAQDRNGDTYTWNLAYSGDAPSFSVSRDFVIGLIKIKKDPPTVATL